MMDNNELRELYQEVILDHNRSPRNYGHLDHPTHHAEGYNPLCGDHLKFFLDVHEGIIKDLRFEGDGCAISKASASILTSELKGKSIIEAEELFAKFFDSVTGEAGENEIEDLGKLGVITGVREFPVRVKCATLAMHTVKSALHGIENISTEEEAV